MLTLEEEAACECFLSRTTFKQSPLSAEGYILSHSLTISLFLSLSLTHTISILIHLLCFSLLQSNSVNLTICFLSLRHVLLFMAFSVPLLIAFLSLNNFLSVVLLPSFSLPCTFLSHSLMPKFKDLSI